MRRTPYSLNVPNWEDALPAGLPQSGGIMNTSPHPTHGAGRNVRMARKTLLAVLAASLASCSSFNPYQRTELATQTIEQAAEKATKESKSLPLAGNLHGAMLVLADQQREWYESLSSQARTRAITQLTLIGATAATLFEGLRPGGNTSEDSKRSLAQAGTLGAVAYFGGDWYLNTSQEDAYINGFRRLSCVMLQIEPFKMSEAEFKVALVERIEQLGDDINDLDEALLIANATHRYPKSDHSPAAQVRREAVQALQLGRTTLAASHRLQTEISRSGNTLLRTGELIFADTAAAIKRANKPLSDPLAKTGASIGNLRTIAKAFTTVGVDPQNEEKKTDETDKDAPDSTATTTTATTTSAPSVTSPPKANENKAPATTQAKAAAATTPLKDASPQALIDELVRKLGAQYDTVIAGLEKKFKQQTADAKTAAKDAATSATQATEAALQSTQACKRSGRKDCELVADVVAQKLAEKTATLYASRRPLSNRLMAFYNAGKAAGANRACTGQTNAMTVAPAEDAKVKPGQEYTIQIGNLPSPPSVVVNGPATYKLEVSAAFTYTLRLTIADGAQGNVQVHISGGNAGSEDITLTVEATKLVKTE